MSKLKFLLFILFLSFIYTGCAVAPSTEENVTETGRDQSESIVTQEELKKQAQEEELNIYQEESENQTQEYETDPYREEARVEPTEEHDKQMLALLDKSCGSQIYIYASVDMDKDGENEMIGVTYDYFSVWYCSSDLKDCYMVSEGPSHGYDDCTIVQMEFDEERHIVIDTYNWMGNDKSYSILALHDGEIEILVNDNYGYVYMNDENNIILDVEVYDGVYENALDIWTTHTWTDTYLYYEDGKYKEYGAATLSEDDFLKFDNAQELLAEIEKENRNENVLEIHYSYFIRENGIVHIQCELEQEEFIEYFHYTYHVNENHLDIEMSKNYGIMYSSLSQLDEVTYPFIEK